MARVEEVRPGGAGLGLAARASGRRLRVLRCGVRFGGERRDPLVQPCDAIVEIAATVADIDIEKLRAAQQHARETDRSRKGSARAPGRPRT